MTRPFLVRLADLISFLMVAYVILSFATNLMFAVANWPDPGRWIAIFLVGAMAITCAIKIGPISRGLVDLGRIP